MLKSIRIDNFDGGRDGFNDQLTIDQSAHASASQNIWYGTSVLMKTPGMTIAAGITATSTASQMYDLYFDGNTQQSYNLYYRITRPDLGPAVPSTNSFPYGSISHTSESLTPLGYTTATAAVANASVSATGGATSWLTNVTTGDIFRINATANKWYPVASVEDNTHLTLSATAVANATGAYLIQPALTLARQAVASLAGSIYYVTTADTMQRFDGTGFLRMASGPKAAFLTIHKNYLFAARTSTAESRLYWSAIKDGTSWPANNNQDVDKDHGKISGIYSLAHELIIFKTGGMFKLLGDSFDPSNPQYQLIRISTPPDFRHNNNWAATEHNGALYFFAYGRFYRYRQGFGYVEEIGKKLLRDMPTAFGVSTDYQAVDNDAQAISFNGFLVFKGLLGARYFGYIMNPSGSWWYAVEDQSGSTVNPWNPGKLVAYSNTSFKPILISGGYNGAYVYLWDLIGPSFPTNYIGSSPSAASAAIKAVYQSKEINIEYGTIKWLVIYLAKQTAGNLTVQWSIDQAALVTYTLDMTAGRGNMLRAVIPIQQKGSSIQLTLSNSTLSQTFKIYAIEIVYEPSPLERII